LTSKLPSNNTCQYISFHIITYHHISLHMITIITYQYRITYHYASLQIIACQTFQHISSHATHIITFDYDYILLHIRTYQPKQFQNVTWHYISLHVITYLHISLRITTYQYIASHIIAYHAVSYHIISYLIYLSMYMYAVTCGGHQIEIMSPLQWFRFGSIIPKSFF
jgi:hypothetical protein